MLQAEYTKKPCDQCSSMFCFIYVYIYIKNQHEPQLHFCIDKEMYLLAAVNAYVAIDFRRRWLSSRSVRR